MTDNIIELRHVKKCYEANKPVVYDFNLSVKRGEFVTFLGPSGCGKTTILRMLAGFEKPTEGEIYLDGKCINDLPPNERQVNTVFQRYALFPHLNIYDNIAFGLRERKLPQNIIKEKVERVLEIVDLEGFEKRKVSSLSGGQQQRIAIARAIVNEPEILLLDEPLAALDYKMRQEMQLELKEMHRELGITFLLVTHDQEEALTMSDKIVVMSKGVLQQEGTAEEIYHRPKNAFVADFIGESNLFNALKVSESKVRFAGAEFSCRDKMPQGTRVDAMIRPEDVMLSEEGGGSLQGEVISSIFKGKYYDVTVLSGKYEIVAQRNGHMETGSRVGIDFAPDGIHIMPSNVHANHVVGYADEQLWLHLTDGSVRIEGLEDVKEGMRIEMYFSPQKAMLSDDAEEGIFRGNITDIIYKGDHYNYRVVSENKTEYSVDDEYLWNIGDYVSIIVPEGELKFRHAPEQKEADE